MPADSVNKVMDDFGNKLVSDIRAELKSKKVTFGGGQDSKLAAKTRFGVTFKPDGFEFDLYMPDYWYFVNNGRKPGPVSEEGRKGIAEWAKRKVIVGKFIQDQLAARIEQQGKSKRKDLKTLKKLPFDKGVKALTFLVARKITKKGYEGNGFLDKVLSDGRVEQLKKDIATAAGKEVLIEIKK